MSEASQIFIRTLNPVHLTESSLGWEAKAKWEKALGSGEHTILVHYHQWCYGVTLAAAVHRILAFHTKNRWHQGEFHPFSPYPETFLSYGLMRRDFNENFDDRCIERYIEFYSFLLSINSNPWKYGRGYGVEGFRFTNTDEDESKVIRNFKKAYQDNGICIIDAVNQKYAFMNISRHGFGYINLPINKPLSAREYARSFYPDKREKFRKSMREIENDNTFIENAKVLKYVESKFRSFKVLTMEEIAKMFPQMQIKIKQKEI